ncbi:MAG: primosomal protein N' [Flavobacteriaceae bacterium]|nr:primosomal protein N' [Flavobacteriaceae bacterium]
MQFADVIVPLSLDGVYTYEIPKELQNQFQIGQRVVVPFGGKKLYTAIVESLHDRKPELYKTKEIYSVLEDFPMVTEAQIFLWKWIADYYLCSLGDVYRNAFPSVLKLESETFIRKTDREIGWTDLDEQETFVMQSLANKSSISLKEIEVFLPKKIIIPTIKSLYDKRLIELDEKIIEKYKPKKITYLRLSPDFEDENLFRSALEDVQRAVKQREALLSFIQILREQTSPVEKKSLVEKSSISAVKSLIDRGYLQEYQLQKDRIKEYGEDVENSRSLSSAQQKAFENIKKQFETHSTVVLHGITSSGKTEIYFHLIDEQLNANKNVLFLLPEIAITTQLVARIKKRFGDEVGVYHSKISQNERAEVWKNALNHRYKILIGARSAIFLPLKNLGLIIVDEEHDSSYKQTDLKPLYNARDCVQILAKQQEAKVLLGSATPSIEAYYNHEQEKYGWVDLQERYGNIRLPEISMIDLKKPSATPNISFELKEEIENSLNAKKQAIIFHNRRGFAPVVECNHCGYSPSCPNCDVSLTYHKATSSLRCHYCGYVMALPNVCPRCHSHSLETKGIGTQQIEEELKFLFPEARIARMDADTMRRKHAYEILFEKMYLHEIDILIGTQMVTKGLDFDNVQLVGVIRADSLLNLPNFRSSERTVQLLTQVSGRAGRRDEEGKVLIQTFIPENPLFLFLQEHNYNLAKDAILYERKEFLYPPYFRLIELTFRHKNQETAHKTAELAAQYLKNYIQEPLILGAEEGIIPRINNLYIYKILIKHPANKSTRNIKTYIKKAVENILQIQKYRSVRIDIDIDPL